MDLNRKTLGALAILSAGLALTLWFRETNNRLTGDLSRPQAFAGDYRFHQGQRGIDSVTLTAPSEVKLPGSRFAVYIDSNSFGDTLSRFEEACRADRNYGDYSSTHVSERMMGKDSIRLVEFDAGNRILSSKAFKVNVVYLNQK